MVHLLLNPFFFILQLLSQCGQLTKDIMVKLYTSDRLLIGNERKRVIHARVEICAILGTSFRGSP